MKKKIVIFITMIFLGLVLGSCSLLDEILGIKKEYKISYYSDNELVFEELLEENNLLTPPELQKDGFNLLGWYKDLNDETSKWNFEKDLLNGHTRLDALWELKEQFIFVENIRLDNNFLYYDIIKGSKVIISFLDKTIQSNTDHIDLNPYKELLTSEVEFSLLGEKEGFTSVVNKVKVKYLESEVYESYNIDFEAFSDDNYKELNKSTYKTSTINDDDFYLYVKEARLTNIAETLKDNKVSLILRKDGEVHLKEGFKTFEKITFNIANYNNQTSTSSVEVMVSSDQLTWFTINSYIPQQNLEHDPFTFITITKSEIQNLINLNDEIYFKFVANVSNINIVLDEIKVYELSEPAYTLSQVSEDKFELSDYYLSVSGLSGKELLDDLRIIVSTNLNPIKYKDIKVILEFADADLDDSSKVIGIYDRLHYRANWGTRSEWHREHVWPNSRLGMDRVKENEVNQGSDPHNLRAIKPSVNSSRSNRYYDQKIDTSLITGHTLAAGAYYPGDKDKGDVARILMYMVVRYEILNLTNSLEILTTSKAYTVEAAYMGLLKNMLNWHIKDPVDEFEIRRNETIYSYQNNRNPFIDHPELFELVYNYLVELDKNVAVNIIDKVVMYLEENEFIKNLNELIIVS